MSLTSYPGHLARRPPILFEKKTIHFQTQRNGTLKGSQIGGTYRGVTLMENKTNRVNTYGRHRLMMATDSVSFTVVP